MKNLIFWVLLILIFFSCNDSIDYIEMDASVHDGGDTKMQYPNGNYGFKPIIRKLDKKFKIETGDILAPFSLDDIYGQPTTHLDLFDLDFDLLVILVSVKDCPPCYDAYAGLLDLQIYLWSKGFKAYMLTVVGGEKVRLGADQKAEIHIQKTAPGPPMKIAVATPAIFPLPTIPESADINA